MRRTTQALAAGVLALALTATSGCLAAAAGGAGLGVAYAQGNSYGIVHADPEQVLDAARAALAERDARIVDEELDRSQPRLTARTPADRRVRVRIEPRTPGRTQLWVRYGTFGDRNQSTMLFIRIKEEAEAESSR